MSSSPSLSPPSKAERPLIATSLAPDKLPRQKAAVESWIEQGFDVVSVNSADEIAALTPHFSRVSFRVAKRDARALAGKPLVPLDEVLAVLREQNCAVSGIVNSDIVLHPLGERRLADAVKELVGDGLTFNKRIDHGEDGKAGTRYDGGIDVFFFGRKLLHGYPATPYYMGLPWWDYFFAAYPLLAGYPTREIDEPIASHLAHKSFYDVKKHWMPLGIETVERLSPLFKDNPALIRTSAMDGAMASIERAVQGTVAPHRLDMVVEEALMAFAESSIQLLKDGLETGGPLVCGDRAYRVDDSARTRARAPERRLRIGVPTFAAANWRGGVERVGHMVRALAALPPAERPHLALVVPPDRAASVSAYQPLFSLVDEIIEIGGAARDWDQLFQHIDFLFPAFRQALPGRPAASWVPDVRDRRLPNVYSPDETAERERSCRAIAADADVLVLSSHAARQDWNVYYPHARPTVRVIEPRATLDPAWLSVDPAAVMVKHGIDEPFVLCSNAFTLYKGYGSLLEAARGLMAKGGSPLFVCTGSTDDPQYTPVLMMIRGLMEKLGVSQRFRLVGHLPRAEQLALMRASLAVVQPSFFESWSMVVEEARLFGKPLILTESRAHFEQAGRDAHYFRTAESAHLETVLAEVIPTLAAGPNLFEEGKALERGRALSLAYGRAICALAEETIAARAAHTPAQQPASPPADTADAVIGQADAFVAQGNFQAAGAILEQGWRQYPDDSAVALRLIQHLARAAQLGDRADSRAR